MGCCWVVLRRRCGVLGAWTCIRGEGQERGGCKGVWAVVVLEVMRKMET